MKRRLNLIFWSCILCVMPLVAAMADLDCPAVVRTAIQMTGDMCSSTSSNQACYGYTQVEAAPQTGIDDLDFNDVGDLADVSAIRSLRLSPLQLDMGQWGVALMRLQANLPAERTAVTLVAFGDVAFDNAVDRSQAVPISVTTTANVNVRRLPSAEASVMGSLSPGQSFTAIDRLEDSTWVRVDAPQLAEPGWVLSSLITSEFDLASLPVATRSQPGLRPMQLFYFESGAEAPACEEMPESGLLIQTPEGVGEIRLWINEVKVQMGSTVYFQAQAGGLMTVMTLEGHARVEAEGREFTAVAGTQVTVPLTSDLRPAGPPTPPVPYDLAALRGLPLSLLDRPVVASEPLTPEEVETAIAVWANGGNGVDNGNGGSGICCLDSAPSSDPNCPGNSCDPCPGNSCEQGNKDGNNGQGDGSGTAGGNSNAGGNGNGNGNAGGNGNGNGGGNGGGN